MTPDNIKSFALIGSDYVPGEVKAICLCFPGLNATQMFDDIANDDKPLAHDGMLFVHPYVNPWNWMNEKTVCFADEIMDIIRQKYPTQPLILRGGSMGGYSVLAYSMFTHHKIDGICAIYPVCDLFYHWTERPDLPRTIHDAMGDYGDISQKLQDRSPTYHPDALPDCPYLFIHGFADVRVNKTAHTDRMVKMLRDLGRDVKYVEAPGMGHGVHFTYEAIAAVKEFLTSYLK